MNEDLITKLRRVAEPANGHVDHRAIAQAADALSADTERTGVEYAFGLGQRVVNWGDYNGRPAVFIAPAKQPGAVGESAEREGLPRNELVEGEIVLTFPTEEQARAVEAALFNRLAAPPAAARIAELEAQLAECKQRLEVEEAHGERYQQQLAEGREREARMREFVEKVSKQLPEKPDYWSSCGQCGNNQSEAEDLLAALAAQKEQK